MSDTYRPPTGPKGQKSAPQGPKGTWKSGKQQYGGQSSKKFKDRDNYRPRGPDYGDEESRPAGPSGYRDGKRPHPDRQQEGSNKRRDFDTGSKRDFKKLRDVRDVRNTRDSRESNSRDSNSRDSNSRDSKDSRGDYRDSRDRRDGQEYRDARDRKDLKEYRDSRDVKEFRDRREGKDFRDSKNARYPKGARDVRDARDQETRPGKPSRSGPKNDAADKPKPKKKQKPKPQRLAPSQIYLVYSYRKTEVYQRIQQVGEGTYGKVYKARNDITGEYVALKKLRLESEREGFPITAMREIKLLQSFDHPNIVGLLEMLVEQNQIYMVLDYLDHDLTGLLTHPDLKLTEGHRKTIFKQLMQGLSYLHARRVIHRDIKGSNILLNSQGVLKITDFGLARTMKVLAAGDKPDYTNRVITIWYRPPELLLGSTDYGREVDIWGVGCLLMELYTKSATFQGTEEISQLFKIFEIMGTPTLESWPDIENMPWFEMLKPRVNRKPRFESQFRPIMGDDAFDLAQKLLEVVPAKRFTADQALEHRYFTSDPQPEPLTFMETLEGEWHEFETKKRRREERKRLQSLKSRGKEVSAPPSQPRAPYSADNLVNSLETPLDYGKSVPGSESRTVDRLEDDAMEETLILDGSDLVKMDIDAEGYQVGDSVVQGVGISEKVQTGEDVEVGEKNNGEKIEVTGVGESTGDVGEKGSPNAEITGSGTLATKAGDSSQSAVSGTSNPVSNIVSNGASDSISTGSGKSSNAVSGASDGAGTATTGEMEPEKVSGEPSHH